MRLAVSPIPINRKPRRCAGVDFMHTVIALACCDYFLLRNGSETGEGVQQPSDAAEGAALTGALHISRNGAKGYALVTASGFVKLDAEANMPLIV